MNKSILLCAVIAVLCPAPAAEAVVQSGLDPIGKFSFYNKADLLAGGTVSSDSSGAYLGNVSNHSIGLTTSAGNSHNLYGNYDPFAGFDITFTNITSSTDYFELDWDIDMQPIPGAPWLMRSMLDVVLTDTGGDGVMLNIGPGAAALLEPYLADNRTEYVLLPSAALGTASLTAPGEYHYASAILPVPAPPVEYATTQHGVMGLRSIFELTPGDTVRLVGRFDIAQSFVPEPNVLVLACSAVFGGVMLRRKRRAFSTAKYTA